MIAIAVVNPAAVAAPAPGLRLKMRLAIQNAVAGMSLIGISACDSVTGVAAINRLAATPAQPVLSSEASTNAHHASIRERAA